jgi:phosphoribosylaminoimidazole-succinocarboxamide synthase
LSRPIPLKGAVLTQMSAYWFEQLGHIKSHYLTADADEIIARVPVLAEHRDAIGGRSMLARRTTPVLFECVVRGYLAGSAWKEYRQQGTLAGEPLPEGLIESQKLEPPIFSPATKAEEGHDENITFDRMQADLGAPLAEQLRDLSLALYTEASARTVERGIIIADTKFEFGHTKDGELVVIDEVLTPDSSRFWPADRYEPGRSQPSFDKQPLRDYLDGLRKCGDWDGNSVPPPLSDEAVQETSSRYQDAYRRITGSPLPSDR